MSTGSALTFTAPTNGVTTTIDTNFALGDAADDAEGTFNLTNCNLVLATGTVTDIISARHQGNSTFTTCAITADGGTAKDNYAFCTNISSTGLWFGSDTGVANYELLIPTTPGSGTETYYFYAELG
jgi:hypothetical protein